jgi:tetratricopeptide (TPR) repeat protein
MNSMTGRRRFAALLFAGLLAGFASLAAADDLKDGRAALQKGDYDQALALFQKAAKQGYAEGQAGVGDVWLKRRQYAKALEAYEQAQKMEPGLAAAQFGQGEVYRHQEKCDQALPFLKKATDLDKKYPEAQLAYGDCLIQTKHHEDAVAALSAGLKWGPKWRPRFLVALGNAELARDSLRDAGIYYTQAAQEAPDDPMAVRALGDFYVKRGTFELAVPQYQAALAKDTSDV